MKYQFSDLVDVGKLNNLLQSFHNITGIPLAITDVEGCVLVAAGWQEICTEFHRKNQKTEAKCRESDAYINNCVAEGKPYAWYMCPNGLIDAGAPIIIDGMHLATVFHGQVLLGKPDKEFFEAQAERYGFDKEAYLAAADKIPFSNTEKIEGIMRCFIELAEMIAGMGIDKLKQMEQSSRAAVKSDEQIYRIFNSTPNVAIQGVDENGNITFWNNVSEKIYGFSRDEAIGKKLEELLFGAEGTGVLTAALKDVSRTNKLSGPTEWTMRHKLGYEVFIYSTMFPVNWSEDRREFICMDVDITEKKNFAKELERLDRLGLIGEMAAGLGHEVRNPMTTVRGYLQMLRSKNCHSEHADQFDLMIEELDHANLIISEYLSLAKNKSINKRLADLNHIIDASMLLLLPEATGGSMNIKWIKGEIEQIMLDDKEIKQLFINIVRNALEAMSAGGVLSVHTYMEKESVVLKISDTGGGIPKQIQDKIGTPFFTTKAEGTGLGLAVCFSIAARHNAKISIKSSSAGTTVLVKFLRGNK